ncbi:hypothetical protein ACFY2M_45230 [Streptomyces sp. NPDC001276]|uniref:hypothetical protein n=1 Tax=Streptomyces sp. NPDC001276 TaxID=3364555 RepID=UPI0036B1FACB
MVALGTERDGRQARPVTGPLVDATAAERAWLLRRAALMDRMALDAPGPVAAAAETAEQPVLHDRRHPDLVAGPYHPDAISLAPQPPPLRPPGVRRLGGRRAPRNLNRPRPDKKKDI